jgi:Tfp pilus assembly protein PilF
MSIRIAGPITLLCLLLAGCATIDQKEPKIDKNSPQAAYQKAEISMNYGLEDEALKYLNEALSIDPDHFPSCYLLGVIQLNKGNLIEARPLFEKCVELKPENPDVHIRLATIYQGLDLEKNAEIEYIKAFSIDQNFISSFNLAQYFFKKNDLDLALKYAQSAVEKNSDSSSAYNLHGVILNALKRYPEAILSFLNALKIDSDNHIAGVNLGVAYINNQEYSKARNLLKKILSLTDDSALKEKISAYLEAIKNI